MRPPEFTGGNSSCRLHPAARSRCFNEAAGIHRRKPPFLNFGREQRNSASMRPPEFTGGNGRGAPRGIQLIAPLQ